MAQAQPFPVGGSREQALDAERVRFNRRQLSNRIAAGVVLALTIISCSILFILLAYFFVKGIPALFPTNPTTGQISFNIDFFTKPPETTLDGTPIGGVAQSIIGTIIIVFVASLMAIPLGLGVAIYLSEYGRGRLFRVVDLVIDLLAGLPSVVVGLFILILLIGQNSVLRVFDNYAGFAGSLALVVIMVPIIARSVEQILRLVPDTLREAGLALGLPKWKVITRIVLPEVAGGIATGLLLAVARAAGESAPVLLTIATQEYMQFNLGQPMDSLPVRIYNYTKTGREEYLAQAWAGTLVLVLVIAVVNVLVRYFTGRKQYGR